MAAEVGEEEEIHSYFPIHAQHFQSSRLFLLLSLLRFTSGVNLKQTVSNCVGRPDENLLKAAGMFCFVFLFTNLNGDKARFKFTYHHEKK